MYVCSVLHLKSFGLSSSPDVRCQLALEIHTQHKSSPNSDTEFNYKLNVSTNLFSRSNSFTNHVTSCRAHFDFGCSWYVNVCTLPIEMMVTKYSIFSPSLSKYAGRDFHDFNVLYRNCETCYEVVGFTATQVRMLDVCGCATDTRGDICQNLNL